MLLSNYKQKKLFRYNTEELFIKNMQFLINRLHNLLNKHIVLLIFRFQ